MLELDENELITLEGFVTNERYWGLIKKVFKGQISDFWDKLRLTDPCDEARVASNHKLAVGVEASLGAIVRDMEDAVRNRRYKEDNTQIVLPDQTQYLYNHNK